MYINVIMIRNARLLLRPQLCEHTDLKLKFSVLFQCVDVIHVCTGCFLVRWLRRNVYALTVKWSNIM